MNENELIQSYCEYASGLIDEEGIYPTPAIAKNSDGTVSIYAMAVNASRIAMTMLANSKKPEIVEQIFAFDTYTKEGQGTNLDSCLIIFHVAREQPARVGVMEYSWNAGSPITKPVDWENAFWRAQYRYLSDDLTRLFCGEKKGATIP